MFKSNFNLCKFVMIGVIGTIGAVSPAFAYNKSRIPGAPTIPAEISVYDGYTFLVKNSGVDLIVRLKGAYGFSDPRLAKCEKEKMRYYTAKRYVQNYFLNARSVEFFNPEFDGKDPGVIYSDVKIDGKDLAQLLIDQDLAGKTSQLDVCK